MPPILTLDTGMSNRLKIAVVDDSYRLLDTHQEHIAPENLQGKIIQEVKRSELERLAIASTWFLSENGLEGFVEKEGKKVSYINLPEIFKETKETGLREFAMYNDAEATALALNVPHQEKVIQAGHPEEAEIKTLVYLGTGFQLVRSQYHHDLKRYLPEYGGGLMAAVPMNLLDNLVSFEFLNEVAEKAGLKSMSQLRHTHLLSVRGLSYIHAAASPLVDEGTKEQKDAATLISEKEQQGRHQRTFTTYSTILGRCLQNFASTAGFNQALYLGGTFATAIAPHLDQQALREAFAVPQHLTRKAYEEIPIIVLDEPFAGNLGAAYGLQNEIGTSAGIPYHE